MEDFESSSNVTIYLRETVTELNSSATSTLY